MNPSKLKKTTILSSAAPSLEGFCPDGTFSPSHSKQSTRKIMSMKQNVTKSLTIKQFNIGYHKQENALNSPIPPPDERSLLLSSRNFARECWDLGDKVSRTSSYIRNARRPAQLSEYRNWLLTHVTDLVELTNAWTDSICATRKEGRPDLRKSLLVLISLAFLYHSYQFIVFHGPNGDELLQTEVC